MTKHNVIAGSIFLSHNHADKLFVRRLARSLESAGVTTWVDEAVMLVGDSLFEKIEHAIAAMEYLGVILSPDSVESEWVKREVRLALTLEMNNKAVKVLPILYRDCEIPPFLRDKLYADFRGGESDTAVFEGSVERLLSRVLPTRPTTTGEAQEILEDSVRQWRTAGLLLDRQRLDYFFERRHDLNLADRRWLAVAESALSAGQFDRWTGLVSDKRVWDSIRYVLTTSQNAPARVEAVRHIGIPTCAREPGYVAFVSDILARPNDYAMKEALVTAVAASEDETVLDDILARFVEKAVTPELQQALIRITYPRPRWYPRLKADFFLKFLYAPVLIGEATYCALEALASLGDATAIPGLKALYASGYSGNEAIGQEYLDKIEQTLRTLGADTSDLTPPF